MRYHHGIQVRRFSNMKQIPEDVKAKEDGENGPWMMIKRLTGNCNRNILVK